MSYEVGVVVSEEDEEREVSEAGGEEISYGGGTEGSDPDDCGQGDCAMDDCDRGDEFETKELRTLDVALVAGLLLVRLLVLAGSIDP